MRSKYFILLASLLVIGVVLIFLGVSWNKKKPLCDKCNVILVSIDTLSSLHLPCYGYERNTAPNLCAFADKNITFLNSYSQTPTTLNSHFSMITGLYPHSHKVTSVLWDILNEKHITLAQLFRANGYKTIFHGPLNDFHLPLDRGFSRGFDIKEPDTLIETWKDAYPKLLKNAEEKKPTFMFFHTYAVHYPYLTGHKDKHLFTNMPEDPTVALTNEEYNVYSSEFFSFTAKTIIEQFKPDSAGNQIYNLYAIARDLNKSTDLEKSKEIFNKIPYSYQEFMWNLWYSKSFNFADKNKMEYLKALYDERIYQMDQELARLLDLMNDPRLSKNTILIITADHGEEFGEHGHWGHANNLYDIETRVPLIIHIPGVGPKKIKDMAQGIDIYPTAINLVGIKPISLIEGINLTGLIKGDKNAAKNKYVLNEYDGQVAIRDNKYKLYLKMFPPSVEFYDLSLDKNEKNNISLQNLAKVSGFLMNLGQINKTQN